jgi:site-specific recombinase XerC
MTPIAPHITAFLREHLPMQRGASEHTRESYAYAFQLLFRFASEDFGSRHRHSVSNSSMRPYLVHGVSGCR